MNKTPKEEVVRSEFLSLIPELDNWGAFVDEILNDFLERNFTSQERIQRKAQHRVKNIESYCEKVLLRKPSSNPILTTTDKVGTRVVLLTTKDVEEVSNFIKNNQDWILVDQSRDYHHEIFEEPELFSYQSDHFIIKPLETYKTSANKEFLTCEIQVRTLLQHAYAEISHDTIYKHASVDNRKAKRALASSMALLEAADEKFIQVYNEINSMASFYDIIKNKLIAYYKQFVPKYNELDYNMELSIILLNIYSNDEQKQIEVEIDDFIKEEYETIKEQIEYYYDKSILFKHPIVLIAMYGILMLQDTTWNKWSLSYDSLIDVMTSMNISVDSMK